MLVVADVDGDADVCGGDADVGDGESVHWLLEYWSWRSARSCFDPGTALPAPDLTLAAGESARESTLLLLPRGHILK